MKVQYNCAGQEWKEKRRMGKKKNRRESRNILKKRQL
jgi:hypothetical protein